MQPFLEMQERYDIINMAFLYTLMGCPGGVGDENTSLQSAYDLAIARELEHF